MSKLWLRLAQEKWPHTQWQQNYRCLDCGRQFVVDYAFKTATEETKGLIKKPCWSATHCMEFAVFSMSA